MLLRFFGEGTGPAVARLYHRLLAAIALIAWLSLAVQVKLLIGSRGLLPINAFVEQPGLSFWRFPSIFLWISPDALIVGGAWLGAATAALALAGIRPRACMAASTFLYLGYATACRSFLGFQWDNLLLECGFLSVFLPRDRPARWIHFLFRVLLFKLYFESGIAKWQSVLGDWKDGSAMTYYYETAPLPTPLAWTAHHLPMWWHHFESRATLVVEILVPLFFFGPRWGRRAALVILTGFQLANFATANYGFFVPLALALHVFLLDEKDLIRMRSRAQLDAQVPAPALWRRWPASALVVVYLAASALEGVVAFADEGGGISAATMGVRRVIAPFRLFNVYHLFGQITRDRFEPELQTYDGVSWAAHDFHDKPGDPKRAPPFVAPHQPRVDFLLWFYGLSYRRGAPDYVAGLLDRMCHDPEAVEGLFTEPLPRAAQAVRIVFWRYHFTEDRADGWWTRAQVAESRAIECIK